MLRLSKLCHNGVGQGERKSCRDRAFLCHDRVLAKPRGFLVVIDHFYVATEFGQDKRILFHDRVWSGLEVLCCDKAILSRDKDWLGQELSYHDRMFLCRDRV